MKHLITLFCLPFFFFGISAQPTIQWQKTLGGNSYDQPLSIQQTTDGGYITTGRTASTSGDVTGNHGGYDFWVIKISSLGEMQWSKTFGGSNHDSPYALQLTRDGGYVVAGLSASSNGNVTGNHGLTDCWIIKLNAAGTIEWQKSFGGSGYDEAWAIQQTDDDGYIFAGRSNSINGDVTGNHGFNDCWVVKLAEDGSLLWQKSFGGSGEDTAYSIRQTSDGGFILLGESNSLDGDVTGNHGDADYWVVKLTINGDIEWQQSFGGIAADIPSDVHQTSDGGYIISGYAGSNNSGDVTGHHGSFDFWVLKLDTNGALEWEKALGGSSTDWGRAISPLSDGSYMVLGTTSSIDGDVIDHYEDPDFWLVKLSHTGDIIWQKILGGSKADHGFAMDQTSDGSFVLAGYAWSEDGDLAGSTIHGYNDFWVVKLAPESVPVKDLLTSEPLEIYPNPAQEFITLKSPLLETSLEVIISDVSGREILRQTTSNGEQINVSTLVPGMYQATVSSSSGIRGAGWFQKL